MARDRQRAKQRKARRAQNPGPAPSRPHPSNAPSPLDHNVPSELGHLGEVDEFEAAIVEGADRADDASEAFGEEEGPDAGRAAFGEDEDEVEDEDDGDGQRERVRGEWNSPPPIKVKSPCVDWIRATGSL